MEKTIGEKRVRVDFNVSGSNDIDYIKQKTANLINKCEDIKPKEGKTVDPEKLRLIALAQTAYEEAAMWAVKAITM